jgi:hypothetical protein
MRYLVAFALFLLVPGLALAERKIVISEKNCRYLVRHTPRDDVAYKPGVDVRGKPVKSADLDGGYQLDLPEDYSFDITHKVFGALKHKAGKLGDSAITLGRVTVSRNGSVKFNGKLLTRKEKHAVAAACRERKAEKKK